MSGTRDKAPSSPLKCKPGRPKKLEQRKPSVAAEYVSLVIDWLVGVRPYSLLGTEVGGVINV